MSSPFRPQISMRLTPEEKALLERVAVRLHLSLRGAMLALAREYLEPGSTRIFDKREEPECKA